MIQRKLLGTKPLTPEEELRVVNRMHAAYDEAKELEEVAEREGKKPPSRRIAALRKTGDELRGHLVLSYMPWLTFLVWRYRDPTIRRWTVDELVSEAYTRLFDLATRYRPQPGKKLASYAGKAIQLHLLCVQGIIEKHPEVVRATVQPIDTCGARQTATRGTVLDMVAAEEQSPTDRKAIAAYCNLSPNMQRAVGLRLGLESNFGMTYGDGAEEMGIRRGHFLYLSSEGIKKMQREFAC